jgi:hypothetical protein
MKHILAAAALTLTLGVIGAGSVHAEYVLPYPGYMPGNKLYAISRLIDTLRQPFYFGNISAYKYHLGLSDKYLVEAKTLFEYKQYLLASDALLRSDSEFARVPVYLRRAASEGKDVRALELQLREAAARHTQVLTGLQSVLPEVFEWKPEKSDATTLSIKDMLRQSGMVRDNAVLTL